MKKKQMEMHCGFEIIITKKSKGLERIVLGKRECKYSPEGFEFVTWRSYQGESPLPPFIYELGHYFFDQNEALADFKIRE